MSIKDKLIKSATKAVVKKVGEYVEYKSIEKGVVDNVFNKTTKTLSKLSGTPYESEILDSFNYSNQFIIKKNGLSFASILNSSIENFAFRVFDIYGDIVYTVVEKSNKYVVLDSNNKKLAEIKEKNPLPSLMEENRNACSIKINSEHFCNVKSYYPKFSKSSNLHIKSDGDFELVENNDTNKKYDIYTNGKTIGTISEAISDLKKDKYSTTYIVGVNSNKYALIAICYAIALNIV